MVLAAQETPCLSDTSEREVVKPLAVHQFFRSMRKATGTIGCPWPVYWLTKTVQRSLNEARVLWMSNSVLNEILCLSNIISCQSFPESVPVCCSTVSFPLGDHMLGFPPDVKCWAYWLQLHQIQLHQTQYLHCWNGFRKATCWHLVLNTSWAPYMSCCFVYF